ncbi:Rieske 2Fe-2S domain-containing protein [Arthrobacter sp. C152]
MIKPGEYVRNAWYVVAWSEEITQDKPLARDILGDPIVMFRAANGEAVVMADRCAHRGFPLSSGRTTERGIQCGYHGFEYDAKGACARVPGQWRIPPGGKQRIYPSVEAHRWVWAWFGDPELADPANVPDTHWMDDPAWDRVTHTRLFEAEAGLLHDNLLDLTHESFLHASTIGDDAVFENGVTIEVDEAVVSVDRFMPDCFPSPLFAKVTNATVVDRWHTTEFQLPAVHIIHSGVVEPGGRREDGYRFEVLNAITPAREGKTWYFYAFCRNFEVGNEEINAVLTESQSTVLNEDADALALQQQSLVRGDKDVEDVLIAQDAGVAMARRVMEQMLLLERSPREKSERRETVR